MRRKLSQYVLATALLAPFAVLACGDDDDQPPGNDAGRAGRDGTSGSANEGGRQSGGSSGMATAGRPSGGSAGASGGRTSGGAGGMDSGEAGEGGTPNEQGGSGGGGSPSSCDLSGEGLDREAIPAEIDQDLTLTNDKVWTIEGTVWIHDGATLTIPPCTRLEGLSDPEPGFIAALRGGRIVADGTADEPILFTSAQPEGERAAGDWGGVVLLGRAPITRPNGEAEAIYEGLTDAEYTYGGSDPEDDSGVLRYVRIEYSGWDIFPDKEVNGLSMAGVGSGTVIEHVMVSNTLDDCFEWWGGTVRADFLIANNCGDDYFDADEGWQGGGQYWFGRRDADFVDSDDPNGFEIDSINDGTTPRTAFAIENVTLCGTGEPSPRANPHFGMVLRELATGEFNDIAVLGFEYAVDTRNAFQSGDVTVTNSALWGISEALGSPDAMDNDEGFADESVFTGDGSNEVDPDPAPFTVAECLADDGPEAAVLDAERGAFVNADVNAAWALDAAWVDWSEE